MKRLLDAGDVGRSLGWTSRRARRWLQRSGVGIKIGGRWFTSAERLIANSPQIFEIVMLGAGSSEDDEYDDAAE